MAPFGNGSHLGTRVEARVSAHHPAGQLSILNVVADLKKSRGKFFHEHRMPSDLNFWIYFFRHAGKPLPENLLSRALEFKPEHSNCPQLSLTIKNLISSIPNEWRALANNVFVGRVMKGDLNAKAWTERQAGVIEINIQYSFTLTAYAAAYDEFFHNIKSFYGDISANRPELDRMVDELNRRFSKPWNELDAAKAQWTDHRLVRTANPIAALGAKGREALHEDMVDAAESFVIAHELAHHLLGHTVTKRDKRKAKIVVDETIERLKIFDSLVQLNQSQREEIQADILAYLIVAGATEGTPSFPDLYRAVAGSTLALVALAHVEESWVELDSAATHPGFTTRFDIIHKLTELLSVEQPAGDIGDHPLGFLAQLSTFAGVALNTWTSRTFPEHQNPVGILEATDHLLRLMDGVYSRIPNARQVVDEAVEPNPRVSSRGTDE
ncbi:ImmA/IrrE family metallo-endopeptidase [Micromonospora sp. CPM1]|uniref:ImmA/IrrE family metallo-endopeptidase n=1 Tax=Micromonospora sp. CPM1 TaxID=2944809 RepID=UPI00207C31AE|nr:ImmA/IrrE family metallo-endopeptidase [Micromonospora sp. CPM1]MCO1618780.1 ImmA/IrrE family metallo-endopeptidase [Micromonospora sp. CPM1]